MQDRVFGTLEHTNTLLALKSRESTKLTIPISWWRNHVVESLTLIWPVFRDCWVQMRISHDVQTIAAHWGLWVAQNNL